MRIMLEQMFMKKYLQSSFEIKGLGEVKNEESI